MATVMPTIRHPVRTAAILFGVASALVTPRALLDDRAPGPAVFFAFGLALCFSLAMLTVGVFLALAGKRLRWFYLWMLLPQLAMASYCVILHWYIWLEGDEGWFTGVAHSARRQLIFC
jgi:hypothetical protein